jgi:hypothetical protein
MLRRLTESFDGPGTDSERALFESARELPRMLGGRPRSIVETALGLAGDPALAQHAGMLIQLLGVQVGAFGPPTIRERGLVERLAVRGVHGQSFSMLVDGLAALARTPEDVDDDSGELGRYTLLRKLPCSPPEECFLATTGDPTEAEIFLRTFPREDLGDERIARLRRHMELSHPGIERVLDFGVVDHRPYVAAEMVTGVNLERLRAHRLSLPIVLALLAEALAALDAIHAAGELHGNLTDGRIRIHALGAVKLCAAWCEPPRHQSEGEEVCALAGRMLSLAVEDRRLMEVLETGDPGALVVAADRLVELHPELDEAIAAVMWKKSDAERLLPLLAAHVPREDALSVIGGLVEDARAAPAPS